MSSCVSGAPFGFVEARRSSRCCVLRAVPAVSRTKEIDERDPVKGVGAGPFGLTEVLEVGDGFGFGFGFGDDDDEGDDVGEGDGLGDVQRSCPIKQSPALAAVGTRKAKAVPRTTVVATMRM